MGVTGNCDMTIDGHGARYCAAFAKDRATGDADTACYGGAFTDFNVVGNVNEVVDDDVVANDRVAKCATCLLYTSDAADE